MIRRVFFNLVCFFNRKNLTVVGRERFTDGAWMYHYKYGSRNYSCLGLPEEPPAGVFFTVSEARTWSSDPGDQDVTERFKTFAGPKCNHVPATGYILHTRKWHWRLSFKNGIQVTLTRAPHKGPDVPINVTNILGQTTVHGPLDHRAP